MNGFRASLIIVGLLVLACNCFADDFYVDAEHGSDVNDGISELGAWQTITHALSHVMPSTEAPVSIHVAQGTYSATSNGETFPLNMRSYVSLIGAGADVTTLDAAKGAPHVIYCDMANNLTIDGFTITGGAANGDQIDSMGGGIYCQLDARPVVQNCRIAENEAIRGGGIYMSFSVPTIRNCEIVRNKVKGALATGGASLGGGIFSYTSFPVIEDCTISENAAEPGPGLRAGGSGAGLYVIYMEPTAADLPSDFAGSLMQTGAGPTIAGCDILDNVCSGSIGNGGGIFCHNAAATVSRCRIAGNSSPKGGGGVAWVSTGQGMRCGRSDNAVDGLIEDCEVAGNSAQFGAGFAIGDSSPKIYSCAITGNHATGNGGAFEFEAPNQNCAPDIGSCTIADNSAGSKSGSVANWWGASPLFENCILWGNGAEHILIESGSVALDYCCVQGGWVGGSDIADDPLFVTGPLGDYYLSCEAAGQGENSPCIDAGSDTAEALVLDQLTTRTDGVPDSGVVDMGYHYPVVSGEAPTIACSLNDVEFAPGDQLVGSLEVTNPGSEIVVDVYLAFILPDGTILCLTSNGLVDAILPWAAGVALPEGFDYGPEAILSTTVPDGLATGNYMFAAALSEPGELSFVGDISFFPFTVEME